MRLFFLPLVMAGVFYGTSAFANEGNTIDGLSVHVDSPKVCASTFKADTGEESVLSFVENALRDGSHFAITDVYKIPIKAPKTFTPTAHDNYVNAILLVKDETKGRYAFYNNHDVDWVNEQLEKKKLKLHVGGRVDGIAYLDKHEVHEDEQRWVINAPMSYDLWLSDDYTDADKYVNHSHEPQIIKVVVVASENTCHNATGLVITDARLIPRQPQEVKESNRMKVKRWLNKLDEKLASLDEKLKQYE